MKVRVYDTLSREFQVLDSEAYSRRQLNLYVCGPTVYNLIHIGNARAFTLFDVFVRFLRRLNFKVRYIRNITDVDDKIIQAAHQKQISFQDLVNQFVTAFHEDVDALRLIRPDLTPRVTEHIQEITQAIQALLGQHVAYSLPDGIYYDVSTFPSYGKLSRKKQEELIKNVRVDVSDQKKNPGDFALWKFSKPKEPSWDAPFGSGRPGWHIECSVMAMKYADQGLDIHGGGIDLIHPHHENEIAQSEALSPATPFSKVWMHTGFLNIGKEKMSKSLGNFIYLRELLKYFHPEVIRLFLLSGHYRSPLEFQLNKLVELHHTLWRFYIQKQEFKELDEIEDRASCEEHAAFQALADDFNTAKAIGLVFETFKRCVKANRQNQFSSDHQKDFFCIQQLARILGVFGSDPQQFFAEVEAIMLHHTDLTKEMIESKIKQRQSARDEKKYQVADAIRDELIQQHISIQDLEDGSASWCIAPDLN